MAVESVVVDNRSIHVVSVGEQGPAGPQGPAGTAGSEVQKLSLSLEAGEDLTAGTPVRVSGNKVYAADNAVNFRAIGVVTTSVLTGFPVTAVTSGVADLSGLTPGSPYFLISGSISPSPPTTGHIIKVGHAVSSTQLLVNIGDGVLLT